MKRLGAITLSALLSAQTPPNDITAVIQKLTREGVESQAIECGISIYSLEFGNPVIDGQNFDYLHADHYLDVSTGTQQKGLTFLFSKKLGDKLQLTAIIDEDGVNTRLDGRPDYVWKRDLDDEGAMQFALAYLTDPCNIAKQMEAQSAQPNSDDVQLFNSTVQFLLKQQ